MQINTEMNLRQVMADAKFYESYSRYIDDEGRYETWEESVTRVMDMHRGYYADKMTDELETAIDFAERLYKEKKTLGAQRALQFGGEQLLKHEARLYNCTSSYCDRTAFFGEMFYLLLCGAGTGISMQTHHVEKLPKVTLRTKRAKEYIVEDSIEGWASALNVLLSSYFVDNQVHPEFAGHSIYFNMSKIRPKGSLISGGFKAPGSESLSASLHLVERVIEDHINSSDKKKLNLRPIDCYDICMHISDSVLSGGIRRSATIIFFSKDDNDMMTAKTGNWFIDNPQRARSNNSVVLIRDEVTKTEFSDIMTSVKEFGEPGFAFFDSTEHLSNPCLIGSSLIRVQNKKTLEESNITIKELCENNLFKKYNVAAYNSTLQIIEWKKIENGGLTKTDTPIVQINFTGNYSISCTPDHKVFTRNRGWVEAEDLKKSDDCVSINHEIINPVDLIDLQNEDVYDLTVEKLHNFFADGVCVHNCFEIGMYPVDEKTGKTGWQGCNLTEINGSKMKSKEDFIEACHASAILGTLQAGYTDFKFLKQESIDIYKREALLGVSLTGWMNSPEVLFDADVMKEGAELVKVINRKIAKMIGINPAARTTAVKPAGNSATILASASGIHPEHSERYIRNMQVNKELELGHLFLETNPYMVEDSVWSNNNTDFVISFPVTAPAGSLLKEKYNGVALLEQVKMVQEHWVGNGRTDELCVDKTVSHNVSNTITVNPNDWKDVEDYIFENRYNFAGVSLLSSSGDKDYNQAPFTAVLTAEQITEKYGDASLFASGLIVDCNKGFANLWEACSIAGQQNEVQCNQEIADSRSDWIRRFLKFADNYFAGDLIKTDHCLKDVYLLHKWNKISLNYKPVDFGELKAKQFTDINTTGAQGCAGGMCEI